MEITNRLNQIYFYALRLVEFRCLCLVMFHELLDFVGNKYYSKLRMNVGKCDLTSIFICFRLLNVKLR